MSYSCIISKQNAAVLLTKIQMWRMTMNELSIIDRLSILKILKLSKYPPHPAFQFKATK